MVPEPRDRTAEVHVKWDTFIYGTAALRPVVHCSKSEYMFVVDHSRCRFLKAVRKDHEEFFSVYKEDFNFQHEFIPLPETIEKNIEEEEAKDYPKVSTGDGSGG